MPIYGYQGKYPIIGQGCYIAPTATLIGDVTIQDGASVWFGAVLRGDVAPIVVGRRSNIQDNVVIHGEEDCPTTIGEDVTVGHSAIIHAATIGDRAIIGMGSVLLSRCRIGSDTIIGAASLVTQNMQMQGDSLVLGSPARVKRELSAAEHEGIVASARRYAQYAANHARTDDSRANF